MYAYYNDNVTQQYKWVTRATKQHVQHTRKRVYIYMYIYKAKKDKKASRISIS